MFPIRMSRRDVRLPDGRADRSGVPDAQEALLAPLTLVFGEAYHPQFEGRRPSSDELEHLTQEMMDKCYALGGMQCPSA